MPNECLNTPTPITNAIHSHAICRACTEGDHAQVLLTEYCECPCHGTLRLTADQVAA